MRHESKRFLLSPARRVCTGCIVFADVSRTRVRKPSARATNARFAEKRLEFVAHFARKYAVGRSLNCETVCLLLYCTSVHNISQLVLTYIGHDFCSIQVAMCVWMSEVAVRDSRSLSSKLEQQVQFVTRSTLQLFPLQLSWQLLHRRDKKHCRHSEPTVYTHGCK